MRAAPDAPDEDGRLAALRSLALLDTGPEERFERITRMAQRMFGVPIALVTLLDADRQWFKSRQGLDAPQTPRDISFCGHAVAANDVLVVEDALADPRFADNPLVVADPSIRFYAGVPVHSGGFPVGTLCVIDRQPRKVSVTDLTALQDLADLLQEELNRQTDGLVDHLTGLLDRGGVERVCAYLLSHAAREGDHAALLFGDLDGLKAINDTYGHAEGDRALREIARLLVATFRDADVVGRLSGDEFCVLFLAEADGFTPAILRGLVERWKATLSDHNLNSGDSYPLGMSVGVASAPATADVLPRLLAEADKAMYAHKRAQPERRVPHQK